MYYTYILKCADGSLYTWITTDLERRVFEHNSSTAWAKYTAMRRPVELVYSANFENRSLACKEEYRIKHLWRTWKFKLIESKKS